MNLFMFKHVSESNLIIQMNNLTEEIFTTSPYVSITMIMMTMVTVMAI
jgi:hypothetical protein